MSPEHPPRPPLDEERLADAGGFAVEVVAATPSTNALVAGRARDGAPEGLVVVTEHQTAGRGRLDRTWQTPPRAALTFSVLLRPRVPAVRWPWLPLLTGHALARVLVRALAGTGASAGVKWPNDVLVDDAKVAGILVERVDTPQGPAAVLGLGLNVTTTADELPVATATSLALAGLAEPDRTGLLLDVLAALRDGVRRVAGRRRRGAAGGVHRGQRDDRPHRARRPPVGGDAHRSRHRDRRRRAAAGPRPAGGAGCGGRRRGARPRGPDRRLTGPGPGSVT